MGSPRVQPRLDLATVSVNANLGRTWVSFLCANAHFKRPIFLNYFAGASEARESVANFLSYKMSKGKTHRRFGRYEEELSNPG